MAADPHDAPEQASPTSRKNRWWRYAALAGLFVGTLLLARIFDFSELLQRERIQELVSDAGAFGIILFMVLFSLGELMHIPGMIFVGAASFAYGEILGFFVAYAGAIASVKTSFIVVRLIGGQPLSDIKNPWFRKMMRRLEDKPILTVVFLRSVFWLGPALNYAMAMSPIRFRDHLIGSLLGLLIPVGIMVFFFEELMSLAATFM